jgi:hypothetical protein
MPISGALSFPSFDAPRPIRPWGLSVVTPSHALAFGMGASAVAIDAIVPSVDPLGILGIVLKIVLSVGAVAIAVSAVLDKLIKYRESRDITLRKDFDTYKLNAAAELQRAKSEAQADILALRMSLDTSHKTNVDLQKAAEALLLKTDERIADRDRANDKRISIIIKNYEARITELQAAADSRNETLGFERSIGTKILDHIAAQDTPKTREQLQAEADATVTPEA